MSGSKQRVPSCRSRVDWSATKPLRSPMSKKTLPLTSLPAHADHTLAKPPGAFVLTTKVLVNEFELTLKLDPKIVLSSSTIGFHVPVTVISHASDDAAWADETAGIAAMPVAAAPVTIVAAVRARARKGAFMMVP